MTRAARSAVAGLLVAGLAAADVGAEPAAPQPTTASPSIGQVLAEGRAARRALMSMLDRARSQRDAVGASCCDGKLSQVNAAMRLLEQARPPLPPRLVDVTRGVIRSLLREGRACTGDRAARAGGPRFAVDVVIDPRIPPEDPSGFPGPR